MSVSPPTYDELLDLIRQLQGQVDTLQAENTRLRDQLEQSQRAGKRQAAPFRKGPPKPNPKTPGRKSGDAHGRHGHRPPPAAAATVQRPCRPMPTVWPTRSGASSVANL